MQKKKLRKIGKGPPNNVNLQINKIPISPQAAFVEFSNNHIKKAVADSWTSIDVENVNKYRPKVGKALTNRF